MKKRRSNAAPSMIRRAYARYGEHFSQRLYADAMSEQSLEPKLSASKVVALGLSLLIDLSTIALFLGGIWCVVAPWFNPGYAFIGALMILTAFEVRPRVTKLPRRAQMLQPARYPRTYSLVARVAESMHAPAPRCIAVEPALNAGVARIGVTRRRYLMLGLPLLYVLDPQERVAVIAHELGHEVNGDPLRGLLPQSALQTLGAWFSLFEPPLPLRVPRGVVWATSQTLLNLMWANSQRAEYLADAWSRRAAGTDAAVGALTMLQQQRVFSLAVHQAGLERAKGSELFDLLAERFDNLRATETPSNGEVAGRLDATHPPAPLRIAFLAAKSEFPTVTLGTGESRAIDEELANLIEPIGQSLIDDYLSTLYR